MSTLKELNIGIEAWVMGLLSIAALVAATWIPHSPSTQPAFEHPTHQLHARIDIAEVTGRGVRPRS